MKMCSTTMKPTLAPSRRRCIAAFACSAITSCGDDEGRASSISASDSTLSSANLTDGGTEPTTATPTTTGQTGTLATDGSGSNSNSDTPTSPGTSDVTTNELTSEVSLTDTVGSSTGDGTSTGGSVCNRGMAGFDFSYLWVANTDQGSVSKVNTETLVEEARYFSDLTQDGVSSPSRTSVNITGRFAVVSNRGTGWVTKIAANVDDCVDKNGNGAIETSLNKDTLLPWGSEECVLWSTQVTSNIFSAGAGPRGTTWTPGTLNPETCKYEEEKVWVGWMTGPGKAVMGRLDGETGVLEATVPLPDWSIVNDPPTGYAPYGAAADADGFVWTSAVAGDQVWRIDPVTLEVKMWKADNGSSHYGMTVDSKGNVWFANIAGHGGISTFDPETETFSVVAGSTGNVFRGIAVGSDGNVWAANNDGGTLGCGVIQVDADTLKVVTFHKFPQCSQPVGVSVDVAGMVWMVDYAGWAYKMDPQTYEKQLVTIANLHYTYSDMTGGGLVNAVLPQ